MADDAPLSDPAQRGGRRVLWPGGLSARLLLATLLVVVVANAIIVPVLLANRQRDWLSDRIAAGELASFVVGAAPQGKPTQQLKAQILKTAGLVVRVRRELSALLKADGFATLAEAVGAR